MVGFDTDVLVAGGGPAGLAAAIAARRKGLRVTVADGAQPPIDKACGEGLMPDGLAALETLGVRLEGPLTCPFRGIRFTDGDASVCADFPYGAGTGMRRTILHGQIRAHAEAAGVELRWNTPIVGIQGHTVHTAHGKLTARWIVGADGSHSLVRRWAGLDQFHLRRTRYGFRRHYRVRPWSEFMEIYWGAEAQIYVTPVAPEEVCVALISRNPQLRLDTALPEFLRVKERLRGAEASSTERGAVSASRRLRSVYQGHVALVGDASGSVDAITGDGLCLAFQQAVALAEALAAENLEQYQAEHRRVARRPALMAELMLLMDGRARLRRHAIGAMAARPGIFADMLAAHVGAIPPLALAATTAMLGWQMLIG